MLLEFSIENFKSFKDQQVFSMLAADTKEEYVDNIATINAKYKVVKTAIIYGANASGKSNFMEALQVFRNNILLSANYSPQNAITDYLPFKFHTNTYQAPTTFSLDFLLKGIRYNYRIVFNQTAFIEEQLAFYPQGRKTLLFHRQEQNFEFGEALKGQKNIVAKLTNSNQLFLSKAAQNNVTQLIEVYQYFNQDFMAIPFLDAVLDYKYTDIIAGYLYNKSAEETYTKNFKQLLGSFDTGIQDLKIRKTKSWKQNFNIVTIHNIYNDKQEIVAQEEQKLEEESTGTQKLFVIAGLILRTLMTGRSIMIDEFERSLHPFISNYILQLFADPNINTKNAQLIVATHDTNLLNKDNQLRRDQVWLIEKDNIGASELFSLADIDGIRSTIPYEKWYLSGRLGGIPAIKKLNFTLNYQPIQN